MIKSSECLECSWWQRPGENGRGRDVDVFSYDRGFFRHFEIGISVSPLTADAAASLFICAHDPTRAPTTKLSVVSKHMVSLNLRLSPQTSVSTLVARQATLYWWQRWDTNLRLRRDWQLKVERAYVFCCDRGFSSRCSGRDVCPDMEEHRGIVGDTQTPTESRLESKIGRLIGFSVRGEK